MQSHSDDIINSVVNWFTTRMMEKPGRQMNHEATGQRLQYNFIKPHMALEGKTPSETVRLQVKGWRELLELATTKSK